MLQESGELGAELAAFEPQLDGGFEITELGAAVIAAAHGFDRVDGFAEGQRSDGIGELNLAAATALDLLQMAKNSFRSAFLDPSEIEGYLAQLDEYDDGGSGATPINIV